MVSFSKKSITFDGVNDYVTAGNVLGFDRTDPFSISCWIRTVTTAASAIVSKLSNTSPFPGYELLIQTTGIIQVQLINTNPTDNLDVRTTTSVNDNRWHHIVFTWDGDMAGGAAGAKIYIDGVSDTLSVITNNLVSSITNSVNFEIGARDGANIPFNGFIDDVGVFDKELSSAEVTELYNSGNPSDLRLTSAAASLVGFWTQGDGDTYPNLRDRQVATPASNTGASVIDRSQNSNDGTPTNMEAADFRSAILASETMPDLSGSGNAGTPTNMEDGDFTTDVPGGRGHSWYSMTLDGVNEYVTMGNQPELDFERTDTFSIECWFKTTSVATDALMGKQGASAPFAGYLLFIDAGKIGFQIVDNASGAMRIDTTTTWNDGAWHHVVAVWDGDVAGGVTGANIYVDKVLQGKSTVFNTLSGSVTNATDFELGARDGGTSVLYTGQLDEPAVYNKLLSSTEVEEHYNGGITIDHRTLSTVGNLVGYWGCGDAGPGGVLRQIARTDGVNEYITMGNPAALQVEQNEDWSVSFWFKTTVECLFISKVITDASGKGWLIFTDGAADLGFILRDNAGAGILLKVTTNSTGWLDGNWHLVTCTWEGTAGTAAANASIYIDGASEALTIDNDNLSGSILTTAHFNVSGRDNGSNIADCSYGAAYFHDKLLSLAEVQALYNSGVPVDPTMLDTEPNLVGYWAMAQSNTGVMTNMTSEDILSESVAGVGGCVYEFDGYLGCAEEDRSVADGCVYVLTSGATIGVGAADVNYLMRAIDDGAPGLYYHYWLVTGNPDPTGAQTTAPFGGPLSDIVVAGVYK